MALGDDLRRISTYERLFGESQVLEDVLCQSYVDIFQFWSRVYQELHRPSMCSSFYPCTVLVYIENLGAMKAVSALVPLRSSKLDKIIEKMRGNAERVDRQTKLAEQERAQHEKLGMFLHLRALETSNIIAQC